MRPASGMRLAGAVVVLFALVLALVACTAGEAATDTSAALAAAPTRTVAPTSTTAAPSTTTTRDVRLAEKGFVAELGPAIQAFYSLLGDQSGGAAHNYSEVHAMLTAWQDRSAPSERTQEFLGRWLSLAVQWEAYFERLKNGDKTMADFVLSSFDTEEASRILGEAAGGLAMDLGLPMNLFVADSTATTSEPATTTTSTVPPTTTTGHPKGWVTVAEFSGSARKITEPFVLSGATARLTYTAGEGRTYFSAFVVPAGQKVDEPGSELVAEISDPGSDTTMLMQDAGTYYLYVIAYDCRWTVVIEEQR